MKISPINKRWVVSDKGKEWTFDTHAEAQEKAHEINIEKIKQMTGESDGY